MPAILKRDRALDPKRQIRAAPRRLAEGGLPPSSVSPVQSPGRDAINRAIINRAAAKLLRVKPADLRALSMAEIEARLSQAHENLLSRQAKPEYSAPSPRQQGKAQPVEKESFLIHNGIPYMPLPEAARYAGVQRETLLTWMKNKVEFGGEPLETLYFKPTGNHFISKASVERLANRFVKWPSGTPANGITLAPTQERTGYLAISDAATVIGVADVTLRKWVRESSGPLEKPLDAVRCTASGYFYVQHQDAIRLAEHIKDVGFQRRRRASPLPAPQ